MNWLVEGLNPIIQKYKTKIGIFSALITPCVQAVKATSFGAQAKVNNGTARPKVRYTVNRRLARVMHDGSGREPQVPTYPLEAG